MAPTTLAATAAAAAALLAGRAAAATTLTLRLLDAGAYPRALCNDGTMSGYWERLSPTGSAIWVVWQSGGGFCYDSASCKKRSVDQRSSRKWTQTVDMDGIFAATDPRLADANLVYVGYCTSDSYFGNATADETPFGYNFLGSEVVAAVFDDLVTNRGLGGDAGTQVLYTGCSAGARGAMFHANAVGATLRARLGDNLARYGVLLDSAFYVDIQPFDASLPSLMSLIQSSAAMTQAASVAMPACAEAYPGDDVWKCFYGQYALPFVTEPYFANSFLYDSYQLGKNGIASKPKTPEGLAYAEAFRNVTSFEMRADVPAKGADVGVMEAACFKHCATKTASWSALSVDDTTFEAAVAGWFFRDAPSPYYLEDTCEGWNCGPGCA